MIVESLKVGDENVRVIISEETITELGKNKVQFNLVVDAEDEHGVKFLEDFDEEVVQLFVADDEEQFTYDLTYFDISEASKTWLYITVVGENRTLLRDDNRSLNDINRDVLVGGAIAMIDKFVDREMDYYRENDKSFKKSKYRDLITAVRSVLFASIGGDAEPVFKFKGVASE